MASAKPQDSTFLWGSYFGILTGDGSLLNDHVPFPWLDGSSHLNQG